MTKNGHFQSLVLALILSCGFAVVWGLAGLWAVQVGEYVLLTNAEGEFLRFLADGTPCVMHGIPGHIGSERYTDLEGNPLTLPEDTESPWLIEAELPAQLPVQATRGDASWEQRICRFADGRSPMVLWYFLTDGQPDGMAYFVGYDSASNACIGYLGAAGFRDAPPSAGERIPFGGAVFGPKSRVICTRSGGVVRSDGIVPGYRSVSRGSGRAPRGFLSPWDVFILGRGVLYHADLQNRTIQIVMEDDRLRSADTLADKSDPARGVLYRLTVRTDDAMWVLDERGQVLRRYTIPEPAREQELTFAEISSGTAVLYWKKPSEDAATKVEYSIYWVSSDGQRREARAFLAPPRAVSPPTQFGTALPSPLFLGGYIAFFHAPRLLDQGMATYPQALAAALGEFWLALLIVQSLACGFAVLCYRRQMRYGAGNAERIVWPLFVLVLGLPGWIGYRFGRSWPVLEKCPECGVAVPRDREGCAHCANEFPLPALKGTEVFA